MNKKRVNEWILPAKNALIKFGIATENGAKVAKTFRGHISSFGAAVVMGSFKAAVAFFVEQGGSSVEREKLIKAMYFVISEKTENAENILEIVCKKQGDELNEFKNQFIDASIALKLAMNFFELV